MRIRSAIAALAILAATAPAAHAADPPNYVALGDSSAAGPLIPAWDVNLACLRSENNYPNLAAKRLGARLTDVTCSGAKVSDFSGRQFGFVPPQYDALRPDTDLVTVSIGANDIGMFQMALSCVNLLPQPWGLSCRDRFTAGGVDQIDQAITAWAPQASAMIREIRTRSPHARIVVFGWGTYVPVDACWPTQPIWARDANYMQGNLDKLSAVLRDAAGREGADYVDLAALTATHHTCAPVAERYYEGLVPFSPAAPLHPNARGMEAFAAELLRVLG